MIFHRLLMVDIRFKSTNDSWTNSEEALTQKSSVLVNNVIRWTSTKVDVEDISEVQISK